MSDPSNLTKSFGSYDETNSSKGFGFLGILMKPRFYLMGVGGEKA